jgi:hypothetical protein
LGKLNFIWIECLKPDRDPVRRVDALDFKGRLWSTVCLKYRACVTNAWIAFEVLVLTVKAVVADCDDTNYVVGLHVTRFRMLLPNV